MVSQMFIVPFKGLPKPKILTVGIYIFIYIYIIQLYSGVYQKTYKMPKTSMVKSPEQFAFFFLYIPYAIFCYSHEKIFFYDMRQSQTFSWSSETITKRYTCLLSIRQYIYIFFFVIIEAIIKRPFSHFMELFESRRRCPLSICLR